MAKRPSLSKSEFAKKHGATCKNVNYAWSYINHTERFVIFGAWEDLIQGNMQLILSDDWKVRNGRRSPGYSQSIRHVEYVVEEQYSLLTFTQVAVDPKKPSRRRVKNFEPALVRKSLIKNGADYFACPYHGVSVTSPDVGQEQLYEGDARTSTLTVYERDDEARRQCLEKKGYSCMVCKFNFEERYGELGSGFIHVHHLIRVADRGGRYKVDPEKHLVPVCPNCHAMIHRGGKNRSLDVIVKAISVATSTG